MEAQLEMSNLDNWQMWMNSLKNIHTASKMCSFPFV